MKRFASVSRVMGAALVAALLAPALQAAPQGIALTDGKICNDSSCVMYDSSSRLAKRHGFGPVFVEPSWEIAPGVISPKTFDQITTEINKRTGRDWAFY